MRSPLESPLALAAAAVLLLVALGALVTTGPWKVTIGLLAAATVVMVFRSALLSWGAVVVAVAAVVMLVPIRRYALPVPLPFALEPYRVLILVAAVALITALLVDPRVRLQRLGFGGVVAAYVASTVVSVGANVGPLSTAGLGDAAVAAAAGAGFLALFFLVVRTVLVSAADVHRLLITLVLSGGLVGLSAGVERVTGVNAFWRLTAVLPLRLVVDRSALERNGGARAFGSAEHPIALSVVLTMLLPIAVHLLVHSPWPRTAGARRALYGGSAVLMLLGSVATVSRTGIVMLLLLGGLVVLQRRSLVKPFLAVGIPAGVLLTLVAPSVTHSILSTFLDPRGLLASQTTSPGTRSGGRLTDLGPSFQEASAHPIAGTGVGSRIVSGPDTNAFILDNQFLSTLLETGLIGLVAVVLLLLVPTAVMLRAGSEASDLPRRWRDLAFALGASMAGYGLACFLFDGFGFLQTLIVFYLLLAAAGWLRVNRSALAAEEEGRASGGPAAGPQEAPGTVAPLDAGR